MKLLDHRGIMKRVHISFANEEYYKSLDLLEKTSLEIGKVDQFIRYTQEWLKTTEFWRKNQYILSQKRGAGFWIYKPHVILETFKNLDENDIVLWSDAGLRVISLLDPLFKVAQECPNDGKVLFKVPAVGVTHKAKMWTKRDCFVLTNSDEEKYWNADMTNGAVSLWVKNDMNIEFLNEWQRYLRDPRIVTDDANICGQPNFPEFRGHRHDQSVLTILAKRHDFELFRDPTQYGNEELDKFTNSAYPEIFWHHRNFKHLQSEC